MITKILLAYDGSANGRRALDIAAELSKKLEADLSIVHVLMHGRPSEELVRMAEVEHLVEEAHKVLPPGILYAPELAHGLLNLDGDVPYAARIITVIGDLLVDYAKTQAQDLGARAVSTSVRNGDFADEILDAAAEQQADMIVVGSRGLGSLRGAVLGSVSQKVLHHADRSVVAVR